MGTKRFVAIDLKDLVQTEENGAHGLIARLIADFSGRVEQYLRDVELAYKNLDFPELKRQAHTLKSSTRVLGLRAASDICKEIEKLAGEGLIEPQKIKDLREEVISGLRELSAYELKRKRR